MKDLNANEQVNQCHPELDSGSHINMTKTQRFRIKSGMTEESGRSMVEMLGVLALVGLLTIIGVAGFRYALNRHYANDLLHEVHRVAYSYSGHLLTAGNGGTFDVNSVEPAAANVSFTLKPYEDYFMVGVEGVEKAVCEQAAGTELPVSFQRRVYCDEGAMEFYFANDMGACDDAEKCALPEVCTEGQNQCGRLCCEQGETCMPGKCCPKGMYIAASNTCCEEGTVPKLVDNVYTCAEPAQGDNCLNDDFTTNQALCNKLTEETSQKLYCKVTSFSGCNPNAATCQPLPTISTATLTKAGTYDMGTWKKAEEKMDWYSAKNFCEALGMELPTSTDVCGTDQNCHNKATLARINTHLSLGYTTGSDGFNSSTDGGAWLESENDCYAYGANGFNQQGVSYWINSIKKTVSARRPICQPKGYEEPPCPTNETYSIPKDTCGLPCTKQLDCNGLETAHYCHFDMGTLNSACTQVQGHCVPYPTSIASAELIKAKNISMQTWVRGPDRLDWWSAKSFCEGLNMELPTQDSFCGTDHQCNNATARRINTQLGLGYSAAADGSNTNRGGGAWLESDDACHAYGANVYNTEYWINSIEKKRQYRRPICQPLNYQEPDCPTGTYDPASDTCVQ